MSYTRSPWTFCEFTSVAAQDYPYMWKQGFHAAHETLPQCATTWSRYPVCIYPVLVFQKKRAPKLAKYWKRCNPITLLTLAIHGFKRHSSGVKLKPLSWLAPYLLEKQNSNWGREELILSILQFYQYKKTHSKGDNLRYVCVNNSRSRV